MRDHHFDLTSVQLDARDARVVRLRAAGDRPRRASTTRLIQQNAPLIVDTRGVYLDRAAATSSKPDVRSHHAPLSSPRSGPQDPLRPGRLRPHRQPTTSARSRSTCRSRRAGRRLRHRPARLRRRPSKRTGAEAYTNLSDMLRQCEADAVVVDHAVRPAPASRRSQIAASRPPRDHRKADGDALGATA